MTKEQLDKIRDEKACAHCFGDDVKCISFHAGFNAATEILLKEMETNKCHENCSTVLYAYHELESQLEKERALSDKILVFANEFLRKALAEYEKARSGE